MSVSVSVCASGIDFSSGSKKRKSEAESIESIDSNEDGRENKKSKTSSDVKHEVTSTSEVIDSTSKEQKLNGQLLCQEERLSYFHALTEFQSQANSSYNSSEICTAKLLTSVKCLLADPSADESLTDGMVEQLVTAIQTVLAINKGANVNRIDANFRNDKRREFGSRRQLTFIAFESLIGIFTALGPKRLGGLNINLALFNQLRLRRSYVLFREPPYIGWTFYHGKFEVDTQALEPFDLTVTHLQHVVHDMEDVISILTQRVGVACFMGNKSKDYDGPNLWWLTAKPPKGKAGTGIRCPSLNLKDSCYGTVRFTFPIRTILSEHPHRYLLGTRHYSREWSHAILLSSKPVCGLGAEIPPVDLADSNSPVVRWAEGATKATWHCYRSDMSNWDQLEFAYEIPKNNVHTFDPSEGEVKIDFVSHNGWCVPCNRAVTGTDNGECQCTSRKAAARLFKVACNAADPTLLQQLRDAGFFTSKVWRLIQAV